MAMSDVAELRRQLLESAIEYHHLKCHAEATGRTEQAGYFERQYEQALTGFNSLAGGDA